MKYGKRNFWRVLRGAFKRRRNCRSELPDYTGRIELTNELIFRKVDKVVREKGLYLEQVTINDIAFMTGTNRTYLSRAMQACADGFVNYMTRLRVEYLISYIREADRQGRVLEGGEDLAIRSGFSSKRAMQRAVRKIYGKGLNEIISEETR